MVVLPLLAALGLASVHLFSQQLRVLDGVPRSRFLSLAGGMAVSFVLLRLLPAVDQGNDVLNEALRRGVLSFIDQPAHLVFLLSLFVFYGAEILVRRSLTTNGDRAPQSTSIAVFWLHTTTFVVMNALIGYLLLHNQERGPTALGLFFVAMMLKFVINDHALHEAHKEKYDRVGRLVLAAAVLVGFGIRYVARFPEPVPVVLQATLAGAVIFNVLKEELPKPTKARYWPFIGGGIAYTGLLLLV